MRSDHTDKDKDLDKNKGNQQSDKRVAEEQDHPRKNHGVPEDPDERRNGAGLAGAENFKRNMGCGG